MFSATKKGEKIQIQNKKMSFKFQEFVPVFSVYFGTLMHTVQNLL